MFAVDARMANWSLLLTLGFSSALAAQPVSFAPPRYFPVRQNPDAVAVADFDHDGKKDLAVANAGGETGSISILLGRGDGTFGAASSYAVGPGPSTIAVGDFNGDGHLDLAVGDGGGSTVSILLGNGDGTFQPARQFASGFEPFSVRTADFNRQIGSGNRQRQ